MQREIFNLVTALSAFETWNCISAASLASECGIGRPTLFSVVDWLLHWRRWQIFHECMEYLKNVKTFSCSQKVYAFSWVYILHKKPALFCVLASLNMARRRNLCAWNISVKVNGNHTFSLKIILYYFLKRTWNIHWAWFPSYCKVLEDNWNQGEI